MEPLRSFAEFQVEPELDLAITEEDIQSILEAIDLLEWEDVVDLYDEDELDIPADIAETLSYEGRQKKRVTARRHARRRAVARSIALKRGSEPKKLMKRSILAARRLAYKQVLHGRKKSQMSPAERANYEKRVDKMYAPYIGRVTQKLYPKMRRIEQSRLKKRGASKTQGPSRKHHSKKHK
jgi:hypothetical protein